ncbi:MAG: YeeE/YedE family protein [Coxiella sp. DG_40]|nr:MAG: YeeE/YedE family protein [Coxiella sp. DG_40]
MFKAIHSNKSVQLLFGLLMGILFGFLLHKGGVTTYDIIMGQLLLEDFTVVKIMLSAVVTGMIGVYCLNSMGLVQLHIKPGSLGQDLIGGLIFGAGFAILGYCPGTLAGAVGHGALDALFGGIPGVLIGAWLFASAYPRLEQGILTRGYFGKLTLPTLLKLNKWAVILLVCAAIIIILFAIEKAGL